MDLGQFQQIANTLTLTAFLLWWGWNERKERIERTDQLMKVLEKRDEQNE